jgi:hypothetical protein
MFTGKRQCLVYIPQRELALGEVEVLYTGVLSFRMDDGCPFSFDVELFILKTPFRVYFFFSCAEGAVPGTA